MAFGNITLNDGTSDSTYTFINQEQGKANYRNLTGSTLALPHSIEISHQAGSSTKPDRHLVKLSRTDENTAGDRLDTGSVHIVIAAPRSIVPLSEMKKMIAEIVHFMSNSANVDSVLAGSYPA